MSRLLALLSGALAVCGVAGCVRNAGPAEKATTAVDAKAAAGDAKAVVGAEPGYAVLRKEALQRLEALRALTVQAEGAGIGVARERVTITTAELFLVYADWDKEHLEEVEAAIASWWRVKKDAPRLARELPGLEMRDLVQVLAAAEKELAEVMQGTVSRRPSSDIDMTALEEKSGYYHQKGRPVFPSSFVWMPDDEKLNRAYGEIGGKYIHLPHIKAEGQKAEIGYEPKDDEPLGYIFMGQKHAPRWLVKKYPEITDGKHHYTGFDTDHPAARQLWASTWGAR